MKKLFLGICFSLCSQTIFFAQQHFCSRTKSATLAREMNLQAKSALAGQIQHELKYDVKFVHLNLNLERTNKIISGGVKTIATVTAAVLDTFMTILHQNHTIDSIRFNGALVSSVRKDSMIKVGLPISLASGTTFTSIVYYHGTAPNGGAAIGSGFSSATSFWGNTNRATWSLSESFVAYHWWPCKQILTDKIDSSWVFVTTDSTNKVGSNGLLKNVVVIGNKKRYEWKSKMPIAYYLISVAVSKFKEYNLYAKPQYLANDSILIQNYIDEAAWNNNGWQTSDKLELNKMPQVMNFLCKMYGMYPFYKEKYGHCMVALGGGMEHNTMTTIGFFDYYINAHELGHQWWGDNVTCKSWGDIWINEGFASYTEHLVAEYLDLPNFATNLNSAHGNVMSQPGGSCYFTNQDTMNSARIFSSRLTYDKGGAIIHSLRFLTNNDSLWFKTLRGFQNTYKNSTASVIDFKNYYQTQTGINPTQFFNQWYYGEGYPTFIVKFNKIGNNLIVRSTQTVSMPGVTPVFITPLEYKIKRTGLADTLVRVMHTNPTETYSFAMNGTVTSIQCDPNNWIINKVLGPSRDTTLGVPIETNLVTKEQGADMIRVSPNPGKGIFSITTKGAAVYRAKIFDLSGKLVLEKNIEKEQFVDLSHYAPGVYVIKCFDENAKENFSQKIIKE